LKITYVYVIAFDRKGRFLMVRHKRRGGWEMPGGHLEPGETPEDAVRREFLEETGHILLDIKECITEPRGGKVFGGIVGKKMAEPRPDEIAEVGMFDALPAPLSFPKVEYEQMLSRIRPLLFAKDQCELPAVDLVIQ